MMLLVVAACSPTAVEAPAASPAAREKEEKVRANPETTAGIHHMQKILAKHGENGAAASQHLQTALDSTFHAILIQCTMKGEDHEKLHHYLEPLPALIRQTGDADSLRTFQARQQLRKRLDEYDKLFQ